MKCSACQSQPCECDKLHNEIIEKLKKLNEDVSKLLDELKEINNK